MFFGSGEKLYAFATAVEGQDAGYKSDQSHFYFRNDLFDALKNHGLVDFDKRTINRNAIADFFGLPPGNQITCLVEANADQAVFVETRVGAVDWKKGGSCISGFQILKEQGGGFQAHPELSNIVRTDSKLLPIAVIDGFRCDFRGFELINDPLSKEQRESIITNYENRREAEQKKVDRIMESSNLTEIQDNDRVDATNERLSEEDRLKESKIRDMENRGYSKEDIKAGLEAYSKILENGREKAIQDEIERKRLEREQGLTR